MAKPSDFTKLMVFHDRNLLILKNNRAVLENMKIRAVLRIKGDVQEAGYRVIIQRTALKMGFTGNAENLKNGDVKVVCECEENELDKFIEAITIKNDFISVENIEKKVEKATGEFESFEIEIGDLAFEMFQGYATAGKYFNWLGKKVDDVGQEVKTVGKKVETVGQKVDTLTVHTDSHFNKLDEKYGIVSETLISMNKEQARTREELTRAVDSLNTLVSSVNP
ncbi:MAG: acylphosphatase [Thermoplasmata archaeon]|nr:MAG: acylphosphatase [Thermoplasmata archaeon]